MAPGSDPSILAETKSASSLTSPPQKPDLHAQQISSLFSKAADGFAAISQQIGAAYVKEGFGGKHGQQHHLSKASIELLIQFAHVDGSADDRKLVAAARQEAFKGVFGPASVKLLKSFQESVRLNKDTGQLEMLPENQRGSGLVADGVLGIRTLNALSQWASLRSSTNPQNGVLAEASQAMKPFSFRIEENGDRTRFDEFVRRTNNLWNVEDGQGAGDGEDYSGSFVVGDGEFSNPSFGKLTPGAMRKVKRIAQSLGTDPDNLLAVMSFETGGTFSPSITNGAGSGATGLIQFMPETARGLGTTTAALSRMSQEQQLDYVEKYFQPYKGRKMSLEDLYMAVLWPAAVGKDNSFVLFSGGVEYSQNSGLDKNRDGKVTKFEAAAKVREHLAKIAPQDLVASN